MSYKVLRLMEYTYDTVARAERDMMAWTVPPTGSKKMGTAGPLIRSSIIQHPDEDEDA